MTSILDRRDHAVCDFDVETGVIAGQGEFVAVCGRTVRVGSMFEPFRKPCQDCVNRPTAPPEVPRRGGFISRLVSWWSRR